MNVDKAETFAVDRFALDEFQNVIRRSSQTIGRLLLEHHGQQPETARKAHGLGAAVAAAQGVADPVIMTMKFQPA